MRKILVGVGVALLATGHTSGQTQKKPPTKEQLEQRKQLDDLTSAGQEVLKTIDDISRARLTACMMAFGHEGFCQCLTKNLALGLDFNGYVTAVTRSKAELGYAKLSLENRALIDSAVSTREACVASVWAH